MPVGPALNFNRSYTDRVKLLHTMEPPYTMLWRKNQSPAQQVAVQQLNQQGYFPTKNNRADFTGGNYPASIVLTQTGKDGCQRLYQTSGACATNGCCPGQKKTPMSQIVNRPMCSSCNAPYPQSVLPVDLHTCTSCTGGTVNNNFTPILPNEPGRQHAQGGLLTLNKHQVQRVERHANNALANHQNGISRAARILRHTPDLHALQERQRDDLRNYYLLGEERTDYGYGRSVVPSHEFN